MLVIIKVDLSKLIADPNRVMPRSACAYKGKDILTGLVIYYLVQTS